MFLDYGRFILIDFEHSGRKGEKPNIVLDTYPVEFTNKDNVPPYLEKHDWYLYGNLMIDAKSIFGIDISATLKQIADSLIQMNDRSNLLVKQNAQSLLKHLKDEREKIEKASY